MTPSVTKCRVICRVTKQKKITTPGPCLGSLGRVYRTVRICSHAAQGANVSTAPVKVIAILDNVNRDRVMKISEP